MCRWLLDNKPDTKLIFTFANTGLEHEKTLDFVDRCDREWGLNVVWLEAVVNPEKGKGIRHKVVNFETAARNGEPFEAVIAKYGITNPDYPHCTRDLKLLPMRGYRKSLELEHAPFCIGIRCDEIDRMSPTASENGLVYPLVEVPHATKEYMRHWWAKQPFDLDLPEHLGNCVTCWKKSDRKLLTIAKSEPERFAFFDRMEKTHGDTGAGDQTRVFFRKHKTARWYLERAAQPFKEFTDHMPELQLGMFDPMDVEADCGAGCEIQ